MNTATVRDFLRSMYEHPFFGVLAYKGLIIVGIIIAVLIINNAAHRLIKKFTYKYSRAASAASMMRTIARVVFWTIGLLVILQTIGVAVTPILTAFGIGGLAVALAVQDTFSNLFAGIHLLIAGQIHVGDTVEIDGTHRGKIVDIVWRYTVIEVSEKEHVIVPNAKMAQSIIRKFSSK